MLLFLAAGCAEPAGAPDIDPPVVAPLPECAAGSPLSLCQCVEGARYQRDLETIAHERAPGSAHWRRVQELCASRFAELGLDVELHDYGTGVNVVGTRAGDVEPGRRVLIGAHYDHIGFCSGADDNATGVAGVLEAARVLSLAPLPRTLVVACWDEEEEGLVGSTAYAAREHDAGRGFDQTFNLDMIGYADSAPGSQEIPPEVTSDLPDVVPAYRARGLRADFIAAIGDFRSRTAMDALARYAERIGLPLIRHDLARELRPTRVGIMWFSASDHASFWEHDAPAIMLNDTALYRYEQTHCIDGNDDVVERLDSDFAARVVTVTVAAAAESLGLD